MPFDTIMSCKGEHPPAFRILGSFGVLSGSFLAPDVSHVYQVIYYVLRDTLHSLSTPLVVKLYKHIHVSIASVPRVALRCHGRRAKLTPRLMALFLMPNLGLTNP